MRNQTLYLAATALLAAATIACGSGSPPASPTTAGLGLVEAGTTGGRLKVTAPVPVSPLGGVVLDDDDPDLLINNASGRFVSNLPLSYVFEVFDEGQRVYRSQPIPAGSNGRTTHEIQTLLKFDEGYTWHAFAVYGGEEGPASPRATFRTYNRFGESCAHLGNEHAIVICRRAQYGFMSVDQRIEFLRRIAYDLNRLPAEHAPYGVLVKSSGHNCNGYSCDIICSDTGRHRQWDVMLDEDGIQAPVWNRLGDVAVRPCEVVE
jgi:hypothetical protein